MWKILFLLAWCIIIPNHTFAQEPAKVPNTHTVQYDFDFYIDSNTKRVDVDLGITLTNTRSDVYISEYSLMFPNTIHFQNLRITQDSADIPFKQVEGDQTQRITFTFAEPLEGPQASNRVKLHYSLDNMHSPRGNIHEVILPLLVNDPTARVNATLHLPEQFNQKISLSKPIPTSVEFRTISWQNVKARTLFMLFGESQTYSVKLNYSLSNSQLTSQEMEIALPPETLYQRIHVRSLKPQPDRTYTDADGNFMGVFNVGPRQTVDVRFDGLVEVFIRPQDSLRDYMRKQFITQQSFLLAQKNVWDVGTFVDSPAFSKLSTAEDIYGFVRETFSYSYDRLESDTDRYGFQKALKNPQKAVCTEYTDAFIALAREKGIPAREIQGYGFSESTEIRPQSNILDELHAWPEYYDVDQELWKQVDATWEDTSGIDYFSSLDVNHIALAIHGKDPLNPRPAGFYKTARRKDVDISSTHIRVEPRVEMEIIPHFTDTLYPGRSFTQKLTVKNTGSSYIHHVAIQPEAKYMVFDSENLILEFLAPFESREIDVTFRVKDGYAQTDTLTFSYDGDVLGTQDITYSHESRTFLYGLYGALGILILIFVRFLYISRPTT